MKTHDLAKALTQLARVLRAGPNIEFEELTNLTTYVSGPRVTKQAPSDKRANNDKATGLVLLAQMASYSKNELLELTEVLGIPIEVRKADAVRDVLGKILKYIQDNPEVRDRLTHGEAHFQSEQPSSLARALAILLKQP